MCCFEATFEPGGERLSAGEGLAYLRLSEVPVIFVGSASMSISEAKFHVHLLMGARYAVKFEEFPAGALEEVASMDMLPGDLEVKVERYVADPTGGLDLGNLVSICGDYERFLETYSMTSDSIPSSVADLLSLAIRGVEAMTRTSILEVRIGGLESTLSSNSTHIG